MAVAFRTNGIPPPQNLGAWLVSFIAQNNRGVSRVELISDERDTATEEMMSAQARSLGTSGQGQWEAHLITFRYVMGGVPFTEQSNVSYVRNPPMPMGHMQSWDWMLFTNTNVRAPTAKFAELKPILYASANSLRSVPKWWTQQQLLIMDFTRQNFVNGMAEIAKRAQQYNQISDANMNAWKKAEASSDRSQNQRVNSINEVDDYRDTDGLGVKLPIHYQNYFSDGKGNYLMTNSSGDPGNDWTKLEPMK